MIIIADVDGPYSRNSCKPAVHRILEFGKELYAMSQTLTEDDSNEAHDMVMVRHLSTISLICLLKGKTF